MGDLVRDDKREGGIVTLVEYASSDRNAILVDERVDRRVVDDDNGESILDVDIALQPLDDRLDPGVGHDERIQQPPCPESDADNCAFSRGSLSGPGHDAAARCPKPTCPELDSAGLAFSRTCTRHSDR